VATNGIVRYDGQGLHALDAGFSNPWALVNALCLFDDGSGEALFVGGALLQVGGTGSSTLAKWDGSSWSAPMASPPSVVQHLAVFDDGTGPKLHMAGSNPPYNTTPMIWQWNGSAWVRLGDLGADLGWPASDVRCMKVLDTGSGPALYAAGFVAAYPDYAGFVARWNGETWDALPLLQYLVPDSYYGLIGIGFVYGLEVFPSGTSLQIHASGDIRAAPLDQIARFDGVAWRSLPQSPAASRYRANGLVRVPGPAGGHLVMGMDYPPSTDPGLLSWDGSAWATLHTGTVKALTSVSNFAIASAWSGIGTSNFTQTIGWVDPPLSLPGAVGAATAAPSASLRISGSSASFQEVSQTTPFALEVVPPPGLVTAQPFALALLAGRPTPWTALDFGSGLGTLAFAPPGFPGADPATAWLVSTTPLLPAWLSAPSAPWTLANLVLPSPSTFTVQGFMQDPTAPLGIAVTNGIIVHQP
jgi:hypothetical protein